MLNCVCCSFNMTPLKLTVATSTKQDTIFAWEEFKKIEKEVTLGTSRQTVGEVKLIFNQQKGGNVLGKKKCENCIYKITSFKP